MNGLDAIINKINTDADNICLRITQDAQTSAQNIIAVKEKEAKSYTEKVLCETENKINIILANADSSADTIKKRAVLEAKSETVLTWIEHSKDYFKNLDDKEYFEFIKQCAINTGKSHNGEVCTLLISKNDKKRLPDNFTDILSDVSHIKISETVVDLKIDFGVIFDFDGIYENCTVDALFDEKYSEICDALFDLINA